MLVLVKFPTQLHYITRLHNPITRNSSKSHHTFATDLNFHNFLFNSRNGLRLKAKKKGDFTLSESESIDTFDVDFEVDDGNYDDDDEDVFVPLDNMKQWLENRPRGFGEGKVYDTSIEDKLMEEIEQSRKAQVANLNKLKNGYVEQSVKKETSKQINSESKVIEDGFRVRLVNLPKKKNIHKDLKLALEGVAGILNIVPVVSGNEKTRDPVCKGLAFVDFKNHDDAHRFVQKFSGKSISFGKVEKQLKCEMMMTASKSPKPPPRSQLSRAGINSTLERADVSETEDLDSNDEPDAPETDSWEESVGSELDDKEEEKSHLSMSYEDAGEIDDTSADFNFSLEEDDDDEKEESSTKSSSSSSSSTKKGRKIKAKEKKAPSSSSSSSKQQSKGKIPKLNIPGSAKRLKIREKTMLANVFSKYKGDSALTVAETK